MSVLRMLVLVASSFQVLFGGCAVVRFTAGTPRSFIAVLAGAMLATMGLISLLGVREPPLQVLSRVLTMRMNVMALLLLLVSAAAVLSIERQLGLTEPRLHFLMAVYVTLAVPLVVNAAALGALARRAARAA